MMERPAGYSSLRRIGDIKTSLRPRDHDGWILLDGRVITRAMYPRFFEVLELSATSVTLPTGRDALLLGAGGRLQLMKQGGSNELTLSVDNLPAHDHGYEDSVAESTASSGGLQAGVLKLVSGVTTRVAKKTSARTGGGKPVRIEPVAIGTNFFIYVGAPQ